MNLEFPNFLEMKNLFTLLKYTHTYIERERADKNSNEAFELYKYFLRIFNYLIQLHSKMNYCINIF
jgi:hypothetical protein